MPDINIGSVTLSDKTRDLLVAYCNVMEAPRRAAIAEMIESYVSAREEEIKGHIEYAAQKRGMPYEECFAKLLEGKLDKSD